MAFKIVDRFLGKTNEKKRPGGSSPEKKIANSGTLEISLKPSEHLTLLNPREKTKIMDKITKILDSSPQLESADQQRIVELLVELLSDRLNSIPHAGGWTKATLDSDLSLGVEIASNREDLSESDKVHQIRLEIEVVGSDGIAAPKKTRVFTILENQAYGYAVTLKSVDNTQRSNLFAQQGY